MKFKDQFRTGWRNIRRQKMRSSLTIFAIVIGAVTVTMMLSIVTSAKSLLTTSFEKTGEDRRIIVTNAPGLDYRESMWNTWSDGTGARLTDEVAANLAKIDHVQGTTPYINWNQNYSGIKAPDGTEYQTKNVGFGAYTPNGTIIRELAAGRLLTADDDNGGVVVSTSVAQMIGYRGKFDELIGQKLTLSPRGDIGGSIKPRTVTVVGVIYYSDGDTIEATLKYGREAAAWTECHNGPNGRQECNTNDEIARNGYGNIYVSVDKKSNVDTVFNSIKSTAVDGKTLGVAAGKDEIDNQAQVFTIIGLVFGGIGAIALFVAAIGVINTMVMATLERTREIGIMRAIGARKKTIRRLFTVEASVLGFAGGLIGIILAFLAAMALNSVINGSLEDGGITTRDIISVPIGLAVVVVLITTFVGALAGLLPAARAARLDPVEALRHE